jgi:hypothetical protein
VSGLTQSLKTFEEQLENERLILSLVGKLEGVDCGIFFFSPLS